MELKKSWSIMALLATSVLLAACQPKEAMAPTSSSSSSTQVVVQPSSKVATKTSTSTSKQPPVAVASQSSPSQTSSAGAEEVPVSGSEEQVAPVTEAETSESVVPVEEASSPVLVTEVGAAPLEVVSEQNQTLPQAETVTTSYFDYSPMAGTWVNGKGEVLVMDANGIVSLRDYSGSDFEISNPLVGASGKISMGVHPVNGYGGFNISYLPAGAMFSGTEGPLEESLDERDYIAVGHSFPADDERFYRQ